MNTLDQAYTKRQLQQLDTIEQAWDGDELKIDDGNVKVGSHYPKIGSGMETILLK